MLRALALFSILIIDSKKLRIHNASIDRYEEVASRRRRNPLAFFTTYKNLYKSLGRSATCRGVMNNLSERVPVVSCHRCTSKREREKEKDVVPFIRSRGLDFWPSPGTTLCR